MLIPKVHRYKMKIGFLSVKRMEFSKPIGLPLIRDCTGFPLPSSDMPGNERFCPLKIISRVSYQISGYLRKPRLLC